jgi:hypothetical protein
MKRLLALVIMTVIVGSAVVAAPTAEARKPPLVAVFDIKDGGAGLTASLRRRLSDYLSLQLAATATYQVVPRDEIKKRLSAQKKASYKACYSQSCHIEIGKELAAQKSLATTIVKLGTVCTVTSVLFDLRKAASEGGASAEGKCDQGSLVRSIKTIVRKLSGGKLASASSPSSKTPAGQKSPEKSAEFSEYGHLRIKSNPPGATVWVNGQKQESVTPIASRVREGKYTVVVKLGSIVQKKVVSVTATDPAELLFDLYRPKNERESASQTTNTVASRSANSVAQRAKPTAASDGPKRWFLNVTFGRAFEVANGYFSQLKVGEELGVHLTNSNAGLGISLVASQAFETATTLTVGGKLFWDINIGYSIQLSPFAQVGYVNMKVSDVPSIWAVDLLFGIDVKVVLARRLQLLLRGIGVNVIVGGDVVDPGVRYDLVAGAGFVF